MIVYFFVFLTVFVPCFILYMAWKQRQVDHRNGCVKSLIVIGSGGHTSEMLRIVVKLTRHYLPRMYIMADNDTTSLVKILSVEKKLESTISDFSIIKVPRSRNVSQSYLTSIYTTAHAAVKSFNHVLNFAPDLILCNGPGTCVPICVIAFVLNKLLRRQTKIIFLESVCRVETLSLSGKILQYFADFVIVQWPELQNKYPSTVYIGRVF